MPPALNQKENNEGGPKPALAGMYFVKRSLKAQLQSKLQLPGRTGVCRWEACVSDCPK